MFAIDETVAHPPDVIRAQRHHSSMKGEPCVLYQMGGQSLKCEDNSGSLNSVSLCSRNTRKGLTLLKRFHTCLRSPSSELDGVLETWAETCYGSCCHKQPSPEHLCQVSFEVPDFTCNSEGLRTNSLGENVPWNLHGSKSIWITISGVGPVTLILNKCPRWFFMNAKF